MKKYIFEATKKQWEKPTEPKQYLCAAAKATVIAETEEQAYEKAAKQLRERFLGTGTILGAIRLIDTIELPADWNYGYGDERKCGTAEVREAVAKDCTR
jgi:hypothetical protein